MSTTAPSPSRSPFPFILVGGLLLAAAAGYVNVVVLSAGGPAVTHVTGSISNLTADAGHRTDGHAEVAAIVACFALGAVLSGALIGGHTLRLGRPYGLAVMAEGALLLAAGLALERSLLGGACLAAAAAGLQNAFASAYRGMVVRTTHVTGILTDLGFMLGTRLGRRQVAGWRFGLLAGLLGSFVGGGLLGAIAWDRLGPAALHAVGVPMVLGGLAYFRWRIRRRDPDDASSGDAPA